MLEVITVLFQVVFVLFLVVLNLAVLYLIWLFPIVGGVKWAQRKGVSPHWMWFGIHPLGGWIAYAIIRWGVQAVACPACHRPLSVKSRFCPHCNTAISAPTTAGGAPSSHFGWWRGKVLCPSCHRFIKLNSSFCQFCSAPTPRLVCPKCKSLQTRLASASALPIAIGVAFFLVVCVAGNIEDTRSGPGDVLDAVDGVLIGTLSVCFILSTICFILAASKSSKRIACSACKTTSRIPSPDPEIGYLANAPHATGSC